VRRERRTSPKITDTAGYNHDIGHEKKGQQQRACCARGRGVKEHETDRKLTLWKAKTKDNPQGTPVRRKKEREILGNGG